MLHPPLRPFFSLQRLVEPTPPDKPLARATNLLGILAAAALALLLRGWW